MGEGDGVGMCFCVGVSEGVCRYTFVSIIVAI